MTKVCNFISHMSFFPETGNTRVDEIDDVLLTDCD